MLRLVAGAGLLSLGSGVRLVKIFRSRDETSKRIDPNKWMKAMNEVDPTDLQKGVVVGFGGIDYNKEGDEMNQQLTNLLKGTSLLTVSTAVSSLNPILGMFFSVFCSLLGVGGSKGDSDYMEKTFERVDKMINGALKTYTARMVKKEITKLVEGINRYAENAELMGHQFPDDFKNAAIEIFDSPGDCWNNPTSKGCLTDRTTGELGGARLLTEIEFMDLIIATFATYRRHKQSDNGWLADFIKRASDRTSEHMKAFKEFRNSLKTITVGRVNHKYACGQRQCSRYHKLNAAWPSQDQITKETLCEFKWGDKKGEQPWMDVCEYNTRSKTYTCDTNVVEKVRDACINDHMKKIKEETDETQKRVDAIARAAAKINKEQGYSAKTAKTAKEELQKRADAIASVSAKIREHQKAKEEALEEAAKAFKKAKEEAAKQEQTAKEEAAKKEQEAPIERRRRRQSSPAPAPTHRRRQSSPAPAPTHRRRMTERRRRRR